MTETSRPKPDEMSPEQGLSNSSVHHDLEGDQPLDSAGLPVSDETRSDNRKATTTVMPSTTKDTNRVSAVWKTAALIFGVGFIFTAGILLGEKLAHAPASFGGLVADNSDDVNGAGSAGNPSDKSKGAKSKALLGVLPSAIADIAAEVAPSVVTIELLPGAPQTKPPQNPMLNPLGNSNPPAPEVPEIGLAAPVRRSLGTGIIMRPDGLILTAAHVVRPNTPIMVGLNDKRRLPAELVGRDVFSDLAVLRIKASDLPAAHFGSVKNLRPGDWAIAIGSPLGFDHTVTLGIISAIGRSIDDEAFHNRVDLIQTDAAINMGNSGGPLLNIKGEVVGINTAIRGDAQNISFAIPVDEARKVALELIAHGEIPRPYLGIYMQDMNPYTASRSGLPNDLTGVLVTQVVPGGPSDKAGLGHNDVIQKVDGQPVLVAAEVRKMTRVKKPGDEFDVEFWRKGSLQTRRVVVGKYPSDQQTGFQTH